MKNTRLIIIEGIPGSGKTTTACFIRDWLEEHNLRSSLFLEGDLDHPADYESTACLEKDQLTELLSNFPEWAEVIQKNCQNVNKKSLIRYGKLLLDNKDHFPVDLIKILAECDIYKLPAKTHCELLKQSWQSFVQNADKENIIHIFECCFLQNPITTLLADNNLPKSEVEQHIYDLSQIIKPLQPKIIYLAQTDIEATLEKVKNERSQAWSDFVVQYLTEQEYGREHHLCGFNGVIKFYKERQSFELELLVRCSLSYKVVSDQFDWDTRRASIIEFIEEE